VIFRFTFELIKENICQQETDDGINSIVTEYS
jgi:hypothetical protein